MSSTRNFDMRQLFATTNPKISTQFPPPQVLQSQQPPSFNPIFPPQLPQPQVIQFPTPTPTPTPTIQLPQPQVIQFPTPTPTIQLPSLSLSPTPPRSSPTPPQSEQIGYVSKMNDKLSVENVLKNYMYTPIAKVTARTPNAETNDGTIVAEYIKAYNPMGIIVFVQLNDGGYASIDRNDLTMTKVGISDIVPYSMRKSAYDMVTPHSTGVAIECKNGVCMVERNTTGSPQETNYIQDITIVEKKTESYMSDDALIAHPIVSLLDIKTNHQLVLEYTEISNRRLLDQTRRDRRGDMDKLEEMFVKFVLEGKRFFSCSLMLGEYLKNVDESQFMMIKTYMESAFGNNPEGCNPCGDSIQPTLEKLKAVSDMETELTKFCRVLVGISEKLSTISSDLGEMSDRIETHLEMFEATQ